jgi:acyl CoA:acetate/3-ketoacid CoA transferase alpha subunit
MIEKVISDLGLVAAECRSNSAGYWEVVKGSAKIWIGIYQAQSDQKYYFEVLSGVMQVPQNNAGNLALDLLALTHGLVGVAFTIYQGHIYLRGSRELEGLDEKEALNILTRVGSIADNYDEELQKKYPHQRSIGYIPSSTK